MERNEFLTINQKGIYSPKLFRLYLVSLFLFGLLLLSILGVIGFVNGVKFVDILLLKKHSWWLFYVIIFPLGYVLQQRKVELTIEPSSSVDVNKLVDYFIQKKFELEYRDEMIVKMINTPKFDWLFGKDLDTVEILMENNLIKLTIAGKRAYDVSHAFRWTKNFIKDESN
jgi:hypothetical protein